MGNMPPQFTRIAASLAMIGIFVYKILQTTSSEAMRAQMINIFLLIVSVIFLVGAVTSEIALPKYPRRILGSTSDYDMEDLIAPRLDGVLLKIAAFLISDGWVGQLARRFLLNLQGPEEMRALANQAKHYPVIFYPFRRISPRCTVSDELAATATNALQQGLTKSYDPTQVVGVMDYHEAYSSEKVTPTQMMFRVFEAMDKFQFMNMFVEFDKERVLEQARASEERWKKKKPLSVFDGVPVCVKDATIVKGFTKLGGMPRREFDQPSKEDDTMVRRLREAGAIILATTVSTEFGRCPLGYNSHFKGPFNPHDERYYTGGSSAGSVVSVMTGLVPIAIAFDGGGSIRTPASFCGAVGLAPTFGRVPCETEDSIMSGNLHAGTNTATTTDTALAYALLAQNEPNHFYTEWFDGGRGGGPPRPTLEGFDRIEDLSDIRVGVFWDYFNDCDPEIREQCRATLQQMENRGAKVVEIRIPHLNALDMAHAHTISVEISFFQEEEFYYRKDLEPAGMVQLAVCNDMTGIEFMAANRLRGWAMDYMQKLFAEKIDVMITPGTPITAPKIPKGALDSGECDMALFATIMRYMFLVNLVGTPGIVIPIGYSSKNGLPVSIQFMADHWNDALLLRISHFVEKKVLQRKAPKHFVKLSLE